MKEVSHHIRLAYLTALSGLEVDRTPIPVFDEEVPVGANIASFGYGKAYVLITDQNEVRSNFNKCGIIQDASVTLMVITTYPKGTGGKLLSERISNEIQHIVNKDIVMNPEFKILSVYKELSRGLVEYGDTESAFNKVIIYTNTINEK